MLSHTRKTRPPQNVAINNTKSKQVKKTPIFSTESTNPRNKLKSVIFRQDATLKAISKGQLTLSIGERGRAIMYIQSALVEANFLSPTHVTGVFDAVTKEAVTAFQKGNGISNETILGTVEQETILLLDKKAADYTLTLDAPPLRRSADNGEEKE